MALLVSDDSRVDGPQAELLHVVYGSLYDTIRQGTTLTRAEADRLTAQALVRIQSRLAAAGFVVRDV